MKYLDLYGLTTFWENAYQKIDDLITTKILEYGSTDKHGAAFPNGKDDKPYHKVASVSCAVNTYLNTNISFYVSEYYKDTSCGILNISLRWNANSDKFYYNRIFWSLNVGINVNDFVLGWSIEDGVVTCNLYVKRTGWTSYALKRIDEQAWGNPNDLWQCYNATYPNNCYEAIPDANTVVSVNETISNSINIANKLATARTISLGGAARGSTTFDGSADKTLDIHTLYESFLDYGGKAINGGITPIDGAAMGELWCNKFAFYNHDYIHVEYTNNYSEDVNGNESGDVVWNDYPFYTDDNRDNVLFNMTTVGATNKSLSVSGSFTAGSAIAGKSRLRVTFDGYEGRYLIGKKILVNVSASGYALGNQILIEHVTKEDYVAGNVNKFTKVSLNTVTGDAGWNSIPYNYVFGSDGYAPYRKIRITLIANGVDSTNRPPKLHSILMLGRHHAVKDSNVATNGLLYTYDYQQNATFPNAIKGKKLITDGGKSTQVVKGDGSLEEESALAVASAIDAEHAEEADYAGVADKADKLTTARTISLSGGAVGTATNFDGSSNINIPVTKIDEGILAWSENYAQRGTLLDNIMKISGNNVLAFMPPSAITIEYSTDNGVTWLDYGWNDNYKTVLVTPEFGNNALFLGKNSSSLSSNNRLRITFDFIAANMRFTPSKACIYFSGVNNSDSFYTKLLIEKYNNYNNDVWEELANQKITTGDWGTFRLPTEDWGYKGGTYRARFRCEFYRTADSVNSTAIGNVIIMATKIVTANSYAKNHHLYTFDFQQNVILPAAITATKHITQNGTANQVVLGNGNVAKIDELGVGMALESEHAIEADYAETAEKLANARTISLSGGASGSVSFDGSKNVVLPLDYLSTNVKFNTQLDTNRVLYPEYDRLISNPLAKYSWHDILAFNTNGWATFERSADGITWEESTNISDRRKPFIHMEKSNYVNVIDSTHKASRWTWNNSDFHYCQAFYLYIGYSWVSVASAFTLQIEIKNREGVWELRKTIDSNGISGSVRLYLISDIAWAEAEGLRITFIKAEDEVEGARLGVTMIKLLSYRSGDQGQGGEKEKPYRWDEYLSLIPRTGLESNIGDTGAYWKNVYAQKFIAYGGTNQQVICADGSKKLISELSPITDADAEILLDNHIHSINVNANGNDVNISVIESSKHGNAWETEDNDITIPLATTTSAGVMSKEDKQKIDAINYDDNTLYVGDGNDGMLTIGYESSKASADLRVMRDRYATIHTTSYNDTTGGSIAVMEANGGTGRMEVNGDKLAELVLSGMDTVRATLTKENEDGTSVETIIDAEEGITAPKFATIGGTSEQILLGDGSLKDLSEISPITVWDGTGMPSLISDFYDSVDMYAFFNLDEYGLKHGGLYIVEAEETFENDAYSQCAMMFVYRRGQNSIVLSSTKDGDLEFELAGNEVYIYGSAGNGTFTLREVLSTNLNI